MRKSEVQPLVALILGGLQIFIPLFRRHGAPDLIPRSVTPFVVKLYSNYEECRPRNDTQEHLVACSVVRGILSAVDLSFCQYEAAGEEDCKTYVLTLDEIILPACTVML